MTGKQNLSVECLSCYKHYETQEDLVYNVCAECWSTILKHSDDLEERAKEIEIE